LPVVGVADGAGGHFCHFRLEMVKPKGTGAAGLHTRLIEFTSSTTIWILRGSHPRGSPMYRPHGLESISNDLRRF
jgi:hypothetical protein